MKKLTLLFFLPILSFSQIQVTETTQTNVKVGFYKYSDFNKGDLYYTILKGDTILMLSYLDERYPRLQDRKSISFKGGLVKAKEIQTLLTSMYSDENKAKDNLTFNFKLDEHEITASKVGKMVMFSTNGKGYFTVNKGNIFTLFGR
jgi:hypothetical protein